MSPNSAPLENKNSLLLSSEENQSVFRLLGARCQTIGTAVVQLFGTQAPDHSHWIKQDTGVLCFIKDNMRKNYFFRLYCLKKNIMTWEQELYNNMEYIASTNFLHTFEGDECMIAFNFASEIEARELKMVVDQKIHAKKRREEKRSSRTNGNLVNQSVLVPSSNQDFAGIKTKNVDSATKRAKRKRNITKADIGIPLEFRHISHVGWDPYKGFDIDGEDEDLKKFFAKAGVSDKQLQDEETRQFIYDFINKHGGQEAVQANISKVSAAAPVTSPSVVPPVPPRAPARPPHSRVAPPPPPLQTKAPKPAAAVVEPKQSSQPPPPPDFAPPPPPLPPPMDVPIYPIESSTSIESVQTVTVMKKVEEKKIIVEDPRSDLLSEIRKGFQLKPATEREIKPVVTPVEQGGGDLAGALARALAERSRAIHSEDDSASNSDSNDDEWDA